MPQKKHSRAPHRRKNHHGTKKAEVFTFSGLRTRFGIPGGVIDRYFPEPLIRRDAHGNLQHIWTRSMVEKAMEHPKVIEAVERNRAEQLQKQRNEQAIRDVLLGFDIEKMRLRAMTLKRRFILHIGPTNSGKTWQALQAMKSADTGVYLGPLRLLALEMYDTMNREGIPCDLLTGEESIHEAGSHHTASTIELADFSKQYNVAVIDEAQMITDSFRGDKWFKAVFCLIADEIHICLAPEARDLLCRILHSFDAPYTIVEHQRLAPLVWSGLFRSIKDAQPGDALIVFSRKAVLAVSAELEQYHIPASVIYGALPPVSRREEVRKFSAGETQVVVATDAIGMGISLPIKRVIFCDTSKFDGRIRRPLLSGEIKQVAGRAGRYGIFDLGEVLSMADGSRIRDALQCEERQKEDVILPFPEEALETPFPLDRLLVEWNRLPRREGFLRVDMTDPLLLYSYIKPFIRHTDRKLVFRLITCPVDVKAEEMILYWLECCKAILKNKSLPEPVSGFATLEECEARYKELDIRHQLLRQIGIEEDRMDEKLELCRLINRYLKEHKDEYLRHCSQCGRMLPATHPYGMCQKCFEKQNNWYRKP